MTSISRPRHHETHESRIFSHHFQSLSSCFGGDKLLSMEGAGYLCTWSCSLTIWACATRPDCQSLNGSATPTIGVISPPPPSLPPSLPLVSWLSIRRSPYIDPGTRLWWNGARRGSKMAPNRRTVSCRDPVFVRRCLLSRDRTMSAKPARRFSFFLTWLSCCEGCYSVVPSGIM